MTVVWIVVVALVVAAVAKLVLWPYAGGESHLGFVSHHWLAEHRVSDMADGR